jgi:hypothetical protein
VTLFQLLLLLSVVALDVNFNIKLTCSAMVDWVSSDKMDHTGVRPTVLHAAMAIISASQHTVLLLLLLVLLESGYSLLLLLAQQLPVDDDFGGDFFGDGLQ